MSKLSASLAPRIVSTTVLALWFAIFSVAVPAANERAEPENAYTAQAADALSPEASPWPLEFSDTGRNYLVYQPQVDRWENNRLTGRSAVSVSNEAGGSPTFGVIYFSAQTDVDPSDHVVTVRDMVISKADFPAVTTGVDDYLSVLRPQLSAHAWRISQDRLQSIMEIDRLTQQAAQQPLKNDPPRILYSERPAILVPIDGNPVLRAVADTGLARVTNTRALLLQDTATSRYYLYLSDHWMEAPSLEGPWSNAARPSAQLEQARQVVMQQDQVDLLQPDPAQGAAPQSVAPQIYVSTTPTELLQTDGPPQYSPIERTRLLYVTNSPNQLFIDLSTQYHYALISGRWYRTTALTGTGQWSYVPPASLPNDFALIPSEHPTQSVRAAVPGTSQAREAVIANSIPQVATVTRSATHLDIQYDGAPAFQPIEGTPLQNAVNAPVPVIRVSENAFYALDNGVWFVADSPFGPWSVTSFVPAVIYSIPRSSPLHYVTYVRVYDATPEVVYVGYSPGYVGSYVSNDNVVVYGTGWPYRPWIGSVWYGAPITWGFGFSFVYSWWNPYPWHYHRAAWAPPRPYYRPWWGPWRARPSHAYGAGRPGIVRDGTTFHSGPRWGNVGRIYDRWDRRSVPWNGPRIANPQRVLGPATLRQRSENGFDAAQQRRRSGPVEDRNRRDSGAELAAPARVWRSRPERDSVAPAVRTPPAVQTPPAAQTPWRRAPEATADPRRIGRSAPRTGEDQRMNREFSPRERVWEQRSPAQATPQAIPRARDDARLIERPRQISRPDRPVPRMQSAPRTPAVGAGPIERATSRVQPRLQAPPARIERPAIARPQTIERPVLAQPRSMERPVIANPSRVFQHPGNGGQRRGSDNQR